MLLLDERNLLVQPPSGVGGIEIGHVHVIVHGLLFGGGDDHRAQCGLHRRALVRAPAHVVPRKPVVRNGGTPGHDFGVAPDKPFGIDARLRLEQVRVSVQVVEILKEREIQRALDVAVRLPPRKFRGEIYGELFIGNRVLENALVARL